MGKKRRYLTNPKKFGRKHFEILDNMDGTDDNQITLSGFPLTIRSLNLVDNGDRTVKLTAEIFGSGSGIEQLGYQFWVTGGVASTRGVSARTGAEQVAFGTSGSTGYTYASSLPAVKDYDGNVFVLPTGKVEILAFLASNANDPGTKTNPKATATAFLQESVNVGAASIGIESTLLDSSLSSTGALTMSCTAGLVGTGPQHGSGSGVGSSQVYAITGAVGHGFHVALSGNLTGSLTLADHSGFATTPNYHGSSSVVLLSSASVAALDSQTLTVTFTPLDVNGAQSTSEAVSTTLTVPFE